MNVVQALTHGYNWSYTKSMKTAISIPDQLFESAEKLARRRGKSRSELYSQAISDYLDHNSDGLVKESLDKLYGSNTDSSGVEDILSELQSRSLRMDRW